MGTAISNFESTQVTEQDTDVENDASIRPNLVFPNEVLEKILQFMSTRDVLISREVCTDWYNYANVCGVIQSEIKVRITSDELTHLANQFPIFTGFLFHKVDVTRQSINFWNSYSDYITHLEFYDCAIIPRNTCDSATASFQLGCPNLKYLGLVNCDKYFLMGGSFIQLDEILCLENLETLNLSQNKNLSDRILLSLLQKTRKLKKIDLSDCINLVYTRAVHNRFYPPTAITTSYSDNILSFYSLDQEFLSKEKGSEMCSFNFGMRLNSVGMGVLLQNDACKWKDVNLESPELKVTDITMFLEKFHQSLEKVKLGRCKLVEENIVNANLFRLKYISIYGCRTIASLNFLVSMPNLRSLKIDGCSGFSLTSEVFLNVPKLEELSINGIQPTNPTEDCITEVVNIFRKLPNLTSLDVGNIPHMITNEVANEILTLTRLRRLTLQGCNITDSGLVILEDSMDSEVPKQFIIDSILPNVIQSLSNLSDLEYLDLSHCHNVGDLTWRIGCRLSCLATLNLSSCSRLSKAGILAIIDNCRNIEKLTMINCPKQIITDSDVVSAAREKLYRCKGIIY